MSKPRPIHQPPREIRSQPDDAEPSFSYEQESFLGAKEEDVEDEFHRRLTSTRKDSTGGGSFWRTSSTPAEFGGPSFSSMSMKQRQDSTASATERIASPGKISVAFQTPPKEQSDSRSAKKAKESVSSKESKRVAKQRSFERRNKMDAMNSDLDLGHVEDDGTGAPLLIPPTDESISQSSSGDLSGSLLYCKAINPPRNGVLLGKSSSLIFPTGVEAPDEENTLSSNSRTRDINVRLDACETIRFPFKKKLILDNMQLNASDIPVNYLAGTPLGNSLHKLSMTCNRLATVPEKLVQCLPLLKTLDLAQCELVTLPDNWSLPQLKKLNLSHNKLKEFPEEKMLEGLPELQELNMYGNKVAEIIVPTNHRLLSKLETLNLGYNDLAYLPEDLDQIKSLRKLEVMNNFLERVPMRVCEMDLRVIDVSSNPVIQPPIETCERGICSMKRYYQCLRLEEQSKHKALEEVQKKLLKTKKREDKKKFSKSKINRFFSKNSSGGSSSKSIGEEINNSLQSSVEEPIVLPSKTDIPKSLGRQRSISFDGGINIQETDTSKTGVDGDTGMSVMKSSLNSTSSLEADIVLVDPEDAVVNDTLKVIFVGMAMTGKTSMIKRLIEGKDAVIPQRDERTIGVDIYEWDPLHNTDRPPVDTRIEIEDTDFTTDSRDVNVKFSVWDFAGQHVYHATHELFFSPRALYVVVWDMGATNQATHRQKAAFQDQGAFGLGYDSSDEEEDDDDFAMEEETRRADRALERDIDEKVQFWVECIQSCAPGAAILPVASFNDYFHKDMDEGRRRCNMLKQRLLKHEERRISGIKERLTEYTSEGRANDEAALRLRKLMCSYTRPKLVFGGDENSVIRVSGTDYTGFDKLTQKIVGLGAGRDKTGQKYSVFRGHVGARIPRMRLEVRDEVRDMRKKFKVVEWGYFLKTLQEKRGLDNVEDISDALHFLTNTGELSYFGNVLSQNNINLSPGKPADCSLRQAGDPDADETFVVVDGKDEMIDPEDNESTNDDTSMTAANSVECSLSTMDEINSSLSQYVFLNPRWLVAAVACILRHDLDREIIETRRSISSSERRGGSVYEGNLNCPVITAEDALLLWNAKYFTRKAADRAQEYSNNMKITPFVFLQRLLIRFGVFVPIDLSIEKAFLGGKEYARAADEDKPPSLVVADGAPPDSHFFFLPSLLGPGEPAEAWTYKNNESWKTTLCHSMLFPDGVPPGLMERITAQVLSTVYAVSKGCEYVVQSAFHGKSIKTVDGPLRVREILCWRTAFFLKVGTEVKNEKGEAKESVVEIFAHLADRESNLCLGSDSMGTGMRRLVISAKGQAGDAGRKIWNGGYLLVLKSVGKIMSGYNGLEYEKQGFCPECISKKMAVGGASSWDWSVIRAAAQNGDTWMRCHHGHQVQTLLVTGPIDKLNQQNVKVESNSNLKINDTDPDVAVNDLLRSIVLVGLWDGKSRKVVRVGSGFIVDKKRGLIVTASHTLMNIWGEKNSPFGDNYYGLRDGKVVVGVIPRQKESESVRTEAVFRYFAKIVAKDPSIDEKGECHLDACVLRITTRMESDIGGNGDGCGDQIETLLLNNPDALKREKLQHLKVSVKCELDEQVRIIGFNQGGESLLGPGERLNRYVDFARGYVCKKFASSEEGTEYVRHRFKPHSEIVVICPTIGGHSGGPCVNQQGEVIGILSRADPAEKQRCYLVPSHEWTGLVKQAKKSY